MFRARNEPLQERLREIERELSRIEAETEVKRSDDGVFEAALADGASLAEKWPTFSMARKREVVESLVNRITIKDDDVEMNLHYLPGAFVKDGGIPCNLWSSITCRRISISDHAAST